MLCHHQSLVTALIIYLAEEFIASLMNGLDLGHRQVEVDTQDHHLVTLHTHHYREYDEARHHDKDAEEHEGGDQQPMIYIFGLLERHMIESGYLVQRHRGHVAQGVEHNKED
jgi:hypothetical protein